MKIEAMAFGVEIEAIVPSEFAVEKYLAAVGVTGWDVGSDYSVKYRTRGSSSREFRSPVYTGPAGFAKLSSDLKQILACPLRVNPSCGQHVHVGFDRQDVDALNRLVCLVARVEGGLFASTGDPGREACGFCDPIRNYGSLSAAMRKLKNQRRHSLNIRSKKPTIEFRCFAGTTEKLRILTHVATSIALVARALADPRSPGFPQRRTAKASGPAGIRELLNFIGWNRGSWDRRCYAGELFCPLGTPSRYSAIEELKRMGERHDGKKKPARRRRAA